MLIYYIYTMDYTHKKHNANMFHFNNFNRDDRKSVHFNTNSDFQFLKPVIVNSIFLSNKNWLISADGDNLIIKKLNKETNKYVIKFTIT